MLRNVSLDEISDGNLYSENDMVKTDTHSCEGCRTVCCQNMGKTIVLDPRDMYELLLATHKTFEEMVNNEIELNVVDGLILPNLKMDSETGKCAFLDDNNRCMVHTARPAICRMFPLGRYWEDETHFKYILQKGECNKGNLSKIKVKKWLGIENLAEYNEYICMWHEYLCKIKQEIPNLTTEQLGVLNTYNLRVFYITPYDENKFWDEFCKRIKSMNIKLGL